MAGKSTSAKQTSGGTPSTAKTTTDGADIQPVRKAAGKVEAFARLSEALASGESMVPPTLLTGQARRERLVQRNRLAQCSPTVGGIGLAQNRKKTGQKIPCTTNPKRLV